MIFFLLNFNSNLTSLRVSMMNFMYFKISKNNGLLRYFLFWVTNTLFLFSVFSLMYSIFLIFLCFLQYGKLASLYKHTDIKQILIITKNCRAQASQWFTRPENMVHGAKFNSGSQRVNFKQIMGYLGSSQMAHSH